MARSIRSFVTVVVLIGASLVLVGGTLGQGDPATPGASPGGSPEASPAASPVAAVTVSIYDFGFEAPEIEVAAGTTVTWTNHGDVIHTTTAKDKTWDSKVMESGDTFSFTFTEPGTYEYWCALHPQMLGTVVVTAP